MYLDTIPGSQPWTSFVGGYLNLCLLFYTSSNAVTNLKNKCQWEEYILSYFSFELD